jgi:ribonuclease E
MSSPEEVVERRLRRDRQFLAESDMHATLAVLVSACLKERPADALDFVGRWAQQQLDAEGAAKKGREEPAETGAPATEEKEEPAATEEAAPPATEEKKEVPAATEEAAPAATEEKKEEPAATEEAAPAATEEKKEEPTVTEEAAPVAEEKPEEAAPAAEEPVAEGSAEDASLATEDSMMCGAAVKIQSKQRQRQAVDEANRRRQANAATPPNPSLSATQPSAAQEPEAQADEGADEGKLEVKPAGRRRSSSVSFAGNGEQEQPAAAE